MTKPRYRVSPTDSTMVQVYKSGWGWSDLKKLSPGKAKNFVAQMKKEAVLTPIETEEEQLMKQQQEPTLKVSVLVATYNRADHLNQALRMYAQQTLPRDQWEYLIVDDSSTDNTKEVIDFWISEGLPIRYFTNDDLGLPKKPGQWRDGCKLRNAVSTFANGWMVIPTHPEIVPPHDALEQMYAAQRQYPKAWITAIPYWLPMGSVEILKRRHKWVRSPKNLIEEMQGLPGFYKENYDPKTEPFPDYTAQNQEVRLTWESEVFSGVTLEMWQWFGGFTEFDVWGPVDIDFSNRRPAMGIPTVFAGSPHSPHRDGILMVYHIEHGDSPRDITLAHQKLPKVAYNAETARKAGGLYTIYNHGPRERAEDEGTKGILGDHIARYQMAVPFAAGRKILDLHCGTGYGAKVLADSGRVSYIGVDINAGAIAHAQSTYGKQGIFLQGDSRDVPRPDQSADLVLCYEGIEHLDTREDQEKLVSEMHRVLAKGGTFILSTPQKGAAQGTPWDINILSKEELDALFTDDMWENKDWFYQPFYSDPNAPRYAGKDPKAIPSTAEIMILGATKKG